MKKLAIMIVLIMLFLLLVGCGTTDLHIRTINTHGGSFSSVYIYQVFSEHKDLIPDGEYFYITDSPVNNYRVEETNIFIGDENTPLSISLSSDYEAVVPSFIDKGSTFLASGFNSDIYGLFVTKEEVDKYKRVTTVEVPKNDDFVITYDSYYNDDKLIYGGPFLQFSFPQYWSNYLRGTRDWNNDQDNASSLPFEFDLTFENGVPKDIIVKSEYAHATAERMAQKYIQEENNDFLQSSIFLGLYGNRVPACHIEKIDHITIKYTITRGDTKNETKAIIYLK